MKVVHVVGARPNFMKITPLLTEMAKAPTVFQQVLVHTGQHYDPQMSNVFFEDLGMPEPDEYLGVGSGTHAQQTARIMLAFEPVIQKHKPDWVVVVGDVNSTVACTLVCSKLATPVAHVEAGLRSQDRAMPEEINRIVTDHLSDLLFTPSEDADENLLREGLDPDKIHRVGNVMIDSLIRNLPKARARMILQALGLQERTFILVTLHRPSNVDDPLTLAKILTGLSELSKLLPVVFPAHPRTRQAIFNLELVSSTIQMTEPMGYLDFLCLTSSARLVITDSGGIQEETTFLGIPCLTVRENTERPITINCGTNRLVDPERIVETARDVLDDDLLQRGVPALWDGLAAQRIVEVFRSLAVR